MKDIELRMNVSVTYWWIAPHKKGEDREKGKKGSSLGSLYRKGKYKGNPSDKLRSSHVYNYIDRRGQNPGGAGRGNRGVKW